MDRLEKFFTENRDAFNGAEPEAGHFDRFREKLEAGAEGGRFRLNRFAMLKVAAVILLLITAIAFVFDFGAGRLMNSLATNGTKTLLPGEMQDVLDYYGTRNSSQLKEFNKLACCGEEKTDLNRDVNDVMNSLDASTTELKQALAKDPDNERLQAALIQNQQMKEQVVDNVISQLKRVKN
jgi:hypothetical protein